jgi:tetratricopeptide (TPR) repeat protein
LSFGNRGSIRGSMSDFEGAIADSSEAIRLNPNYAMAFFNRAIARAQIGDVPGAISDVERAAILSPGDPAISKFLQQLKAGR